MAKQQHLSREQRLIRTGRLQGIKENMDMIGMVLLDKLKEVRKRG